jgi:hypothetical protein
METHAHGCVFVSVDLLTNYNQGNARTWMCVCLSGYEPQDMRRDIQRWSVYIDSSVQLFARRDTKSVSDAGPTASMRKKNSTNLFIAHQLPGALQLVYIPAAHVYMMRYR